MNYTLYITRADLWAVNEDCPIRADEWLDYVAGDPELEPQPQHGTFACAWMSADAGPGGALLDWNSGNACIQNPGRATVGKLLQIAQHLGANVQGDNGERYDSLADYDSQYPANNGA